MIPKSIGRYRIIGELASGGMATVYLARDSETSAPVAIKILAGELFRDARSRARFRQQVNILPRLSHDGIVSVLDFGDHDDQFYLVTRYMPGGSLADRIGRRTLDLDEVVAIIERIAAALDYAHFHGITHGDVKPSDILFDEAGAAYLSDFGYVSFFRWATTETRARPIGTPAYMSPEQLLGDHKLDGRSDIYSLGVILFEMLTGELPYKTDSQLLQAMQHVSAPIPSIRARRPDLPQALQKVIDRALAKRPEDRYQTAGALAADLRRIESNRAFAPTVAGPGFPINWALISIAVAAIVFIIGIAIPSFSSEKPTELPLISTAALTPTERPIEFPATSTAAITIAEPPTERPTNRPTSRPATPTAAALTPPTEPPTPPNTAIPSQSPVPTETPPPLDTATATLSSATMVAELATAQPTPADLIAVIQVTQEVLSDGTVISSAELEFKSLGLGTIEVIAPEVMTVGDAGTVTLRITPNSALPASQPFTIYPDASGEVEPTPLVNAPIDIYPLMTATLSGREAYHIESSSTETQPIISSAASVWTWIVTPLKPGEHELNLTISIPVVISGEMGVVATRPIKVLKLDIEVERPLLFWVLLALVVGIIVLILYMLYRFIARPRWMEAKPLSNELLIVLVNDLDGQKGLTEEEVMQLLFNMGGYDYSNFEGNTKKGKLISLVTYFARRNLIDKLVHEACQINTSDEFLANYQAAKEAELSKQKKVSP